jgi:phospholipase/lecithinase/hemolysin
MLLIIVPLLSLFSLVSSAVIEPRNNYPAAPQKWSASRFNSLITFGDSYTDENRLNYFQIHQGAAPPPGTYLPESFSAPSGGRTWDRYVVQYTGKEVNGKFQPGIELYNYAVSGAVCSNDITPRLVSPSAEDWRSSSQSNAGNLPEPEA